MRIFANHLDAIRELLREVREFGLTVPVSHFQDRWVKNDKDYYTVELLGYTYKVSQANNKLDEMVRFLYPGQEGEELLEYCTLELKDRLSGEPRNPGEAYKSRYSLWEEFLEDKQKFSYSYAARINDPALEKNQLQTVIDELKTSPDSRQGIIQIYNYLYDAKNIGGKHRCPCTMHYQFLIRNKKLHGIYVMRSNDLLTHYVIDIWEACHIQMYIAEQLGIDVASFSYFSGSLHAYHKDFPKFVF